MPRSADKAWAKPGLIDLAAFGESGSLPACFFDADVTGGMAPAASCSPVELTIRQSFRRIEANDYEPADWDGLRFQAFGAFTTSRMGYARNYDTGSFKLNFVDRVYKDAWVLGWRDYGTPYMVEQHSPKPGGTYSE